MLEQLPHPPPILHGLCAALLSETYFQRDGNQAKQELLQVVVTVSINDCTLQLYNVCIVSVFVLCQTYLSYTPACSFLNRKIQVLSGQLLNKGTCWNTQEEKTVFWENYKLLRGRTQHADGLEGVHVKIPGLFLISILILGAEQGWAPGSFMQISFYWLK